MGYCKDIYIETVEELEWVASTGDTERINAVTAYLSGEAGSTYGVISPTFEANLDMDINGFQEAWGRILEEQAAEDAEAGCSSTALPRCSGEAKTELGKAEDGAAPVGVEGTTLTSAASAVCEAAVRGGGWAKGGAAAATTSGRRPILKTVDAALATTSSEQLV